VKTSRELFGHGKQSRGYRAGNSAVWKFKANYRFNDQLASLWSDVTPSA
jgi:hypothetical protein